MPVTDLWYPLLYRWYPSLYWHNTKWNMGRHFNQTGRLFDGCHCLDECKQTPVLNSLRWLLVIYKSRLLLVHLLLPLLLHFKWNGSQSFCGSTSIIIRYNSVAYREKHEHVMIEPTTIIAARTYLRENRWKTNCDFRGLASLISKIVTVITKA